MHFLTVSDEVVPAIYSLNIKERFPDIQAVLGCGDLPPYYLEFIVTMLACAVFLCPWQSQWRRIYRGWRRYTARHVVACRSRGTSV